MESPMPTMIFVNLPVADVEKSIAFHEPAPEPARFDDEQHASIASAYQAA
jgi:predicted lactoylglutathione lyase